MLPDLEAEDARSIRRRLSQMGDVSVTNYPAFGGTGNGAGDGISMHSTTTIPGSNYDRNVGNSPKHGERPLGDGKAKFSSV
jgi:hypothetical protein